MNLISQNKQVIIYSSYVIVNFFNLLRKLTEPVQPRGNPLLDGLQRPGLEPEDGGVQFRVQYRV